MIGPFEHPNYHRNEDRCGEGEMPCVICGKPVKQEDAKHWVRVVDGGARFGVPGEEVDEAGDMGCFPVGPGCWRKHRKELAPIEVSI